MLISLFNWFVKITAWPVQAIVFRLRVLYEDSAVQTRRIKGPAIIISNHTTVFDYAAFLFVFFSRTLRYQMAEVLFKKRPLGLFLRMLGGIRIDRDSRDYGFIARSEDILRNGGVVGIFPEGRLPREGEERPLPFRPGAAYLALLTGVKVIPVYTGGGYFAKGRSKVVVGAPFYAAELTEEGLTEKENIDLVSRRMRERVIELGKLSDERKER